MCPNTSAPMLDNHQMWWIVLTILLILGPLVEVHVIHGYCYGSILAAVDIKHKMLVLSSWTCPTYISCCHAMLASMHVRCMRDLVLVPFLFCHLWRRWCNWRLSCIFVVIVVKILLHSLLQLVVLVCQFAPFLVNVRLPVSTVTSTKFTVDAGYGITGLLPLRSYGGCPLILMD